MTYPDLVRILDNIKIFDRTFEISRFEDHAGYEASHGWFIQVVYIEPDVDTGKPAVQRSRKWLIDSEATETDVVRTVYAAVTRSYAHVVSEHFTYKGKRVFGPHISIDALLDACTHVE